MVPVIDQSQPSRWTKDEERDVVWLREHKRYTQGPADPLAYSPPPSKTTLYNSATDGTYPSFGTASYDRFSKKDAGPWALHPPPSGVPPPGSYDPPSSFLHAPATPRLKPQFAATPLPSLGSPRAVSPRSNVAPSTKSLDSRVSPRSVARPAAPRSMVPSQYYMRSRFDTPRKMSPRASPRDPDRPRQETVAAFMSVDKGSNIVHYMQPPYADHVRLTLSRGARSGMDTVSRRRPEAYVGPLVSRNGTPVLSHVAGRGPGQ